LAFIFAQAVASVLGAYGLNGFHGFSGAGWGYVLVAWVWSIIWYIPLDCAKAAFHAIQKTGLWQEWVDLEQNSIHPYGNKFRRLIHRHPILKKDKGAKGEETKDLTGVIVSSSNEDEEAKP